MSAQKFKFVSPGVFLNEIDNSQLPKDAPAVGPVIIGRASQGPALQPVRIESMAEFIETFGNPIAGGTGTDVWREGNGLLAPSYAAYAVQSYLRNSGPVNFVRLLGVQDANATANTGEAGYGQNGKAYALLIAKSGSSTAAGPGALNNTTHTLTASIGAVFYTTDVIGDIKVEISGAAHQSEFLAGTYSTATTSHRGVFVNTDSAVGTTGKNCLFKVLVTDLEAGGGTETVVFNFNPNSDKFIRKVFNTNPTLTNSAISTATSPRTKYWLGETFETHITENILTGARLAPGDFIAGAATYAATIVELYGGAADTASDFSFENSEAQTGWFISQQTSNNVASYSSYDPINMQKLFKFHGLGYGESIQRRFKVSIQDIRPANENSANPYGSFTVVIRDIKDTDEVPVVIERFSNCNLNPQSSNYIARKIGDTYNQYDSTKKRNRVYGNYPNISRYIRVEVNQDLDNGSLPAELLPFGFFGPPTRKPLVAQTMGKHVADSNGNSLATDYFVGSDNAKYPAAVWLSAISSSVDGVVTDKTTTFSPCTANVNVSSPSLALRLSASDGTLASPTDAYFGIRTTKAAGSTEFDPSVLDNLRTLPDSITGERFPSSATSATQTTAPSFLFSLDDIMADTTNEKYYYLSGSRKAGDSYTVSTTWRDLLSTAGIDRFTAPFYGGHDGIDITEQDPFNNTRLGSSAAASSAYASVTRAIDLVTDPESIECNMMTMPGLTNATLTKKIIDTCEARSDALAVIDLPAVYTPPHESKQDNFAARAGTLSSVVSTFEQRGINSSYGCTYYPWVMVYDEISDKSVWVPPSVIALGVFANTENRAAVWFAPAGFNRGGLTEGSAGLPVINVSEKLTSADRDKLYSANINPIASFPSEGIVVFGQKTLQVTPSALDRINVRRLMIYVKKEISRIANRLLFDQNVQTTWLRFVSEVKPFLESVKLGFGLSDFAVVLDNSTTTPDLVDRNIMYAKIFLKPARAIEFIAIDFVITNTGAAFED